MICICNVFLLRFMTNILLANWNHFIFIIINVFVLLNVSTQKFALARWNRFRIRILFLFRNLIRFHTEIIRRIYNFRHFQNIMFVLPSYVVSLRVVSCKSKTLYVLIIVLFHIYNSLISNLFAKLYFSRNCFKSIFMLRAICWIYNVWMSKCRASFNH